MHMVSFVDLVLGVGQGYSRGAKDPGSLHQALSWAVLPYAVAGSQEDKHWGHSLELA